MYRARRLSGLWDPHGPFVNGALSEVSHAELNDFRNVKTVKRETVAVGLEGIQNRASLFLSIVRNPHVTFVNGAFSEISQAELDSQRNVKAANCHAVAVGLGVIQNRARFFFIAPIRCPSREVRHDR